MLTNLVIYAQLVITTNTEAQLNSVSETERLEIVRTVEHRSLKFHLDGTPYIFPISTNILGESRSTLRLEGTNWVAGAPGPKHAPSSPPVPEVPQKVVIPPPPPPLPTAPHRRT